MSCIRCGVVCARLCALDCEKDAWDDNDDALDYNQNGLVKLDGSNEMEAWITIRMALYG